MFESPRPCLKFGGDDAQDEAWTKVLTLNLQRVFTLTQKCLPLLRAAANEGGKNGETYVDPARIINVGCFLSTRIH